MRKLSRVLGLGTGLLGGVLVTWGCASGASTIGGAPDGGAAIGACTSTTSCAAPRQTASVSGDSPDGSAARLTGTGSEWVQVRVREDVSAWTGTALRLTATLTPPPGEELELLAYGDLAERAPDGGVWPDGGPPIPCAIAVARGDGSHAVALTWGEPSDGGSANGLDDGRNLALEVRHTSGTCSARWSLEIHGN